MENIRSMLKWLKSSAIPVVFGAALLLPWVAGEVIPRNPRPAGA